MSSEKGLNPSSIGRENVEMIFQLIQRAGEITRTEISSSSGLSKTAISSSVTQLLDKDLILEDKHRRYSKVGRKPRLLSINPEGRHFISIDIGGTKVTYGLGNLTGELLDTETKTTPDHWEKLYEDILNHVRNSSEWSSEGFSQIDGVAIAVPGVVNENGTVHYAPNIEGLDRVQLRQELGQVLDIPIFLENDVNASALGEYQKRKSVYTDIVFIAIGTGIGAGIINDGELFTGFSNHAGEVGWLVSDVDYMETKKNGKKGWLESRISGPDIVRRAKQKLENNLEDPLSDYESGLNPKVILQNELDSPVAGELIEDWIKVVSMLISNITNIVDPQLVVLGGGVSKTGGEYIEEVRHRVARNTQRTPEIELTLLGDKAPIYGGFAVCRKNISEFIWENGSRA
ncbi:MAG: ROK family transcriptional regulator [Candidatus Bipolaricaulota bacterium]